MTIPNGLTLVVIYLALGLLSGRAGAEVPDWLKPEAVDEASRSLEVAQRVLRATERRDARPAVEALSDPSWLIRLLGARRMETLGLPRPTARALLRLAQPGEFPRSDWEPYRMAQAYAEELPVAETPAAKITSSQALRTVVGLGGEYLMEGAASASDRLGMLQHCLAFYPLARGDDRGWVALALVALVDEERLLLDLGRKGLADAVGADGRQILDWFARNEQVLYWHSRQRRFLVDVAARLAGESSATYRKTHPWPRGSGD